MTLEQTLDALRSLGTEQNRKIYARHGVSETMFGVSSADLSKMRRRIGVDHALAQRLWKTGNHDARVLATMIADPEKADDALLEAWVKDLENYGISGAFAKFAGATALARQKVEKWTKSKQEWIGAAGWDLMAHVAMKDGTLSDDTFEEVLANVEREIHRSKNRVRYSMNGALIAIGMRNPRLQKRALAVAKRIGVVDVDHGATACKTPDAAEYIRKATRRGGRKPMQVAPGA